MFSDFKTDFRVTFIVRLYMYLFFRYDGKEQIVLFANTPRRASYCETGVEKKAIIFLQKNINVSIFRDKFIMLCH